MDGTFGQRTGSLSADSIRFVSGVRFFRDQKPSLTSHKGTQPDIFTAWQQCDDSAGCPGHA